MFKQKKTQQPIDAIIHNLALSAVLTQCGSKNWAQVSAAGVYLPELSGPKRRRVSNKIAAMPVVLYSPTITELDQHLRASNSSEIVLLFHQRYSIDYWLQVVAEKYRVAEPALDHFLAVSEVKAIIHHHQYRVVADQGSFLAGKFLWLLLPKMGQRAAGGLLRMLDQWFGHTILRSLMRNRVIKIVPYTQTTGKHSLDDVYAQISLRFDQDYNDQTPVGKSYHRNVAHLIEMMRLTRRHRVLDIGTGTGSMALGAAEQGAQVTALDISQTMMQMAQQKANKRQLQINFVVGDAEQLPFRSKSFDVVVTASVPHDVNNFDQFLAEISRVLKPQGRLFINVNNPYSLAGLEVLLKVFLKLHPPYRVLPRSYVSSVATRHGLTLTDSWGIELFQGLPMPWSWKWSLTNYFSAAERKLAHSSLQYLYSQFFLVYTKQ